MGEKYVDNDLSAYSGKTLTACQRMLSDLRDRSRDAVLVYHVDRLTQRPIELEQFVAGVDDARVRAGRFIVGDTDLGTSDGLMVLQMLSAVAASESAAGGAGGSGSRLLERPSVASGTAPTPWRQSDP